MGDAKMADMPAAAPATSRVLRSADDRWKSCAKSEPNAPPVMMIGPSAPKGPPVPIEIAEETGFRIATFASRRLRPIRMASSASGMPWPRIFGDPHRAMAPMTSPPTTGTATLQAPSVFCAGETFWEENRPKYARLVMAPISQTRAQATTEAMAPMTIAAAESRARGRRSNSRRAARGGRGARGLSHGEALCAPRESAGTATVARPGAARRCRGSARVRAG